MHVCIYKYICMGVCATTKIFFLIKKCDEIYQKIILIKKLI